MWSIVTLLTKINKSFTIFEVFIVINKLFKRNITFTGDYRSWLAALNASLSYDDNKIFLTKSLRLSKSLGLSKLFLFVYGRAICKKSFIGFK